MSILKINNLNIIKKSSSNSTKNKIIINNLSLDIDKNSFTTVIGNSDSGKTVLIDSIFDLLPKNLSLESGDIFYNGKSVLKTKNNKNDNDIVVIFNNPKIIFNDNYKVKNQIIDMLLMKRKFQNKKDLLAKLYHYLELLDVDKKVLDNYPNYVDNKNIKKIAIVFAMLFNPKILIIDDSFHRLDSISIKLIYLFLKEFKDKLTIIFFTSINTSMINLSDKLYYLYNGTILESLNYKKIGKYKLIHPYRKLFNNEISLSNEQDILTDSLKGCIYYSMCFKKRNACLEFDNTLKELEDEHFLSCMYLED
jgi:ABC-type dipeptide/oligopeptide/nickel transport system ATPase component